MVDVEAATGVPGTDRGTALPDAVVVRPAARGFPEVDVVRRARLVAQEGSLVFRDALGRRRTWSGGPHGELVDALYVDLGTLCASDPSVRFDEVLGESRLGFVDLRTRDETSVLRIPLEAWTPEARDGVTSADALRRSGVAALLTALRLPVRHVRRVEDAAFRPVLDEVLRRPHRPRVTRLDPGRGVGLHWLVLRLLCVLPVVVGLLLGTAIPDQSGVWFLCAGVFLALCGALDLWRYAVNIRRDRRSTSVLTPEAVLPAHPGVPVPAAFVDRACLRLEEDDIVVVDQLGTERWLPRSGPDAVREIAVVHATGFPQRVELRTVHGLRRAVLPWDSWFAGPCGMEDLQAWGERAGLVVDPHARDVMHRGLVPVGYTPMPRELVQRYRSMRPALPPAGMFPQLIGFSLFAVLLSLLHGAQARAGTALAAAVLLTALGLRVDSGWQVRRGHLPVDPPGEDDDTQEPDAPGAPQEPDAPEQPAAPEEPDRARDSGGGS